MKTAFLFAGQGSQVVSMAKEFYDACPESKALMDSLTCDFDLKQLCFEGPQEQLNDTAYAQAAIVSASLTILEAIKTRGIRADVCAGLSLGEYTALSYAGAMSAQTAVDIVRQRGQIMAHALPAGRTGMAAVLGLDAGKILEVCEAVSNEDQILEIANYNCPGQIVITGHVQAIEKAQSLLTEKGARRVVPLAVSGAFHSSLLQEAGEKLGTVLEQSELSLPEIPVYHNLSGKPESLQDTSELIDILKAQICHSVRFEQTLRNMIEEGVDTFVEIGPGKTLSGFVKKIDRTKKVFAINTPADLERMCEAWNK